MEIKIEKLTEKQINELNIKSWPIWEKEESKFNWFYDQEERCYFLEGEVEVTFNGKKIKIQKGDYVIFPKGLSCEWNILKKVKKHYSFK